MPEFVRFASRAPSRQARSTTTSAAGHRTPRAVNRGPAPSRPSRPGDTPVELSYLLTQLGITADTTVRNVAVPTQVQLQQKPDHETSPRWGPFAPSFGSSTPVRRARTDLLNTGGDIHRVDTHSTPNTDRYSQHHLRRSWTSRRSGSDESTPSVTAAAAAPASLDDPRHHLDGNARSQRATHPRCAAIP